MADYYVGENGRDFVCSDVAESGMTKCSQIPAFVDSGRWRCNQSAMPHTDYHPLSSGSRAGLLSGNATDGVTAGDCVNWNRYYRACKPAGSNPFQGSISFDNIGLAWVAIFQVGFCSSRHSRIAKIFPSGEVTEGFSGFFFFIEVQTKCCWARRTICTSNSIANLLNLRDLLQ